MTNITSGRPASYSSKHERDIVLQRPRQNAVAEFGDLLAVVQDDGVLADQIDARDMAVEIDAHARPVEARRDLLDMGRFAGAVIAGDHDAAVVGEAGEDGEGGFAIEQIVRVGVRNVLVGRRIGRDLEVGVDAEQLGAPRPSGPARARPRRLYHLRVAFILRSAGGRARSVRTVPQSD